VTSVMKGQLQSKLPEVLSPKLVNAVLQNSEVIKTLPSKTQDAVRTIFSDGHNLQFRIIAIVTAAQLLATLLMFQKKPMRIVEKK
jgi:hypothetical protein